MRKEMFIFLVLGTAMCAGACSRTGGPGPAAETQTGILTGRVTSEAEGPMEGVLVSAKAGGGTITVTVVSDSQGRYVFPTGRLKSGTYRLRIRAAGYDLEDPGLIDVGSNKTTDVDLKLQKTRDLAPQLMNAEWFMSIEGTPEHKTGLNVRLDLLDKDRCTMCHSFYFITRNGHDAHEWVGVLDRMRFHNPGSSPINPTDFPYSPRLVKYWGEEQGLLAYDQEAAGKIPDKVAAQAAYLASINLSTSRDGTWPYPLRTLPRPRGAETKVIMTEYDLPRPDSQPHDAVADADGMIWYCDFGRNFIGRLNPRTGEVKEWAIPEAKVFPPFAEGGLDIELDQEGNPWFAATRAATLWKFDKKTERMTSWNLPPPITLRTGITMITAPKVGKVWFQENGNPNGPMLDALDLKTNQIARYKIQGQYGMVATSNGNVVFFSFGNAAVGELDPKTGKSTLYPTPTPASAPRRGHLDAHGLAWFAEYWTGKIAMFDPTTKQIKEWAIPAPYADPYDAVADKNGDVWSGGMVTDYVFRLNPATGHVTNYLMPTVNANVRRIDVDSSTTPVSVWVGENHHPTILRVEPLAGQ
jgi:virginiamycin B lyase